MKSILEVPQPDSTQLKQVGLFACLESSDKSSAFQTINNVPKCYICPITKELMRDPVIYTKDSKTYEREAIESRIKTNTSLQDNQTVEKVVYPNRNLKTAIDKFLEQENKPYNDKPFK